MSCLRCEGAASVCGARMCSARMCGMRICGPAMSAVSASPLPVQLPEHVRPRAWGYRITRLPATSAAYSPPRLLAAAATAAAPSTPPTAEPRATCTNARRVPPGKKKQTPTEVHRRKGEGLGEGPSGGVLGECGGNIRVRRCRGEMASAAGCGVCRRSFTLAEGIHGRHNFPHSCGYCKFKQQRKVEIGMIF